MTTPTGQLSVQLDSDSMFLKHCAPIEVRDSNMRLVQRSSGSRQFNLPVGLYEVSTVLEDGHKHSTLVQVREGKQTLELGPEQEGAAPETLAPGQTIYARPRFTRKMALLADTEPEADPDIAVQFIEANGASLVQETRRQWTFVCTEATGTVPSALFQIGNRKQIVSLPISAYGSDRSKICAVRIKESSASIHAHAWISPERIVANALQNMLASGYILEAADVADEAVELLRDKYQDPIGAALGALILYKTGRLERWTSWVENLARDFEWLPDGAVILASLLRSNDSASDRVLELAIQASQQRMLYTESYSMLLDLLRRWPRDDKRQERHEALKVMASLAPYIDWEAICLSYSIPNEDE